MQITCKCLNVTIDTQGSSIQDIDVTSLNLTVAEKNDTFFKELLNAVEHGRISKVQSSLVQVRNAGCWIIHCCLNCAMNTHAIHRDKGAAVVIFNKSLVANPEDIGALKNSDKYSPVFRIIIDHPEIDDSNLQAPTKFAVSQLPAPIQTAISALQQQLTEMIQQETVRIEDKVRQYSEQQYAALEEFREHAHHDHRLLARLLSEAQEKFESPTVGHPSSLESLETPPSTPDNQNIPTTLLPTSVRPALRSLVSVASPSNYSPHNVYNLEETPKLQSTNVQQGKQSSQISSHIFDNTVRAEKIIPARLFSHSKGRKCAGNSFDTEGLFDLEGMEDNSSQLVHSEEETDTDGNISSDMFYMDSGSHDEGIHIPRERGIINNLAKSLPVNVPSYLPQEKRGRKERDEERDDERPPQDPVDIAASIKALAKSVHGDANVFGDLPRPRFSTQI